MSTHMCHIFDLENVDGVHPVILSQSQVQSSKTCRNSWVLVEKCGQIPFEKGDMIIICR